MARYYFHIREGGRRIPDDDGEELPNLEAARAEARLSAQDLIAECLKAAQEVGDREI